MYRIYSMSHIMALGLLIPSFDASAATRTITGDIFVDFSNQQNMPAVSGDYCTILKKDGYDLGMKEGDLVVPASVKFEAHSKKILSLFPPFVQEGNVTPQDHPLLNQFPHFLPLGMFLNDDGELKAEGDTIQF